VCDFFLKLYIAEKLQRLSTFHLQRGKQGSARGKGIIDFSSFYLDFPTSGFLSLYCHLNIPVHVCNRFLQSGRIEWFLM